MKTVVVGEPPAIVTQLIAERAAKGLDLFDEIWEGEYHMAPAPHSRHGLVDRQLAAILDPRARAVGLVPLGPFNLGSANDYRVPDSGYTVSTPNGTFVETAAIVVEIVSPGDETFDKFDFYASHGVDELIVVDPLEHCVLFFAVADGGFQATDQSQLLGFTVADVASLIDWPE
jgi:Uma2 family endonuclease